MTTSSPRKHVITFEEIVSGGSLTVTQMRNAAKEKNIYIPTQIDKKVLKKEDIQRLLLEGLEKINRGESAAKPVSRNTTNTKAPRIHVAKTIRVPKNKGLKGKAPPKHIPSKAAIEAARKQKEEENESDTTDDETTEEMSSEI